MYGRGQHIYGQSVNHTFLKEMANQAAGIQGHPLMYGNSELPLLTPQEVEGQVCGGGASVYYSHTLQMLFFSYSNGECTTSKIYTSPHQF